ncbi:hypothetical protein [Aureispira sp. CCB-QB1]|uniref:hypothetical protein n=1 Tax=Aureispira sp. CCB-QB1 TaxID=1313421 RepID=UPI000695B2CE|nr:hypothetical protein [Aureispira sp. CCB-QB1]
MSNKLHFYTKYSKEKIKISDKPFASGGEGAIYAIASPRTYSYMVAKIYYPEKRTAEREAKMQYLMQHPPITFSKNQAPSIGWVQDLVYKDKQFIGILLLKIEGKKLTKLTLSKLPRKADKAWQRFAFQQPNALKLRLRTCFNLAVVIHQIHASGQYVLVDLKPDNILMQPNGLLAVVDMDSVEVIKDGKAIFSAPVATPEYTPPEHYKGPRGTILETWDYFSLGVIFYQLLLGLHPFAASCHSPYENLVGLNDKIENDLYVHHSQKQSFFKVIPPPHKQFLHIPKEVQELFQNCFEYGAQDPSFRPSPADWCNTLADLLKLPFTKIPKNTIPPSNLYFTPNSLLNRLSIALPALPATQYPNKGITSADISLPTPTLQKNVLLQELQEAYKQRLHSHREFLLQSILVSIILGVLLFTYPMFFVFALALLLIIAPQLFLTKFRHGIDHIGKVIISPSTYQRLKIDDKSPLTNKTIASTQKLVSTLVDQKQQALIKQKNKLNNKSEKKVQKELDLIQQHLSKRTDLEQQITQLKTWTQTIQKDIESAREKELEAYKVANKTFLEKLKKQPAFNKYEFKSFISLRIKIQQAISAIKGKISIHEKPLMHLETEQQRELQKLKDVNFESTVNSHYKKLKTKAAKELERFKSQITNNQINQRKEFWVFIQQKNSIKNKSHQQQQKLKYQFNKIVDKTRKELGLNSKSELNSYIDLLSNLHSAEEFEFAPKEVKKRFDVFLEKINAFNIDPLFSKELFHLLTQELPKVNFDTPQKVKNLSDLVGLKLNMVNTWEINQSKLEALDQALDKLANQPEILNDPIELAFWVKTRQEQLNDIIFNLQQYCDIQEVFYGDPIIFRLKNRLEKYQEQVNEIEQETERLNMVCEEKIKALEKENIDLINAQKKLEQEKAEQEKLILAKEKELNQKIDEQIHLYRQSLEKEQNDNIEKLLKKQTKELTTLKKEQNKLHTNLISKLETAEQELEQLDQLHNQFKISIDAIRTKAELVYQPNQLIATEKCNAINDLASDIRGEYSRISELIKKNGAAYKTLLNRSLKYQKQIDELAQLQEEKIRIDTLSEWQKKHTSKTYLKDLLFNTLEQFENN